MHRYAWLLSASLIPALLPGAQREAAPQPTVTVTGEATVMVQPDEAEMDIGVVAQAETAAAASAENAKRVSSLLARLKGAPGVAEIKTLSYALTPVYRYPKDGSKPSLAGYSASNVVRLKINDIAKAGGIADAAVESGANVVRSLQFTVRDESQPRTEALRGAAVQARSKAEAIAAALNQRVVRIVSVEERHEPGRPIIERTFAAAQSDVAGVQTPVEAGTLEIKASVNLVVEIAP